MAVERELISRRIALGKVAQLGVLAFIPGALSEQVAGLISDNGTRRSDTLPFIDNPDFLTSAQLATEPLRRLFPNKKFPHINVIQGRDRRRVTGNFDGQAQIILPRILPIWDKGAMNQINDAVKRVAVHEVSHALNAAYGQDQDGKFDLSERIMAVVSDLYKPSVDQRGFFAEEFDNNNPYLVLVGHPDSNSGELMASAVSMIVCEPQQLIAALSAEPGRGLGAPTPEQIHHKRSVATITAATIASIVETTGVAFPYKEYGISEDDFIGAIEDALAPLRDQRNETLLQVMALIRKKDTGHR